MKVDAAQLDIVRGLKKAGYRVYEIGLPCDLLVYGWSNRLQRFRWQTLEVKTPTAAGKRRKRTDQKEQDQFLADTRTPVVLSLDQAMAALEAA